MSAKGLYYLWGVLIIASAFFGITHLIRSEDFQSTIRSGWKTEFRLVAGYLSDKLRAKPELPTRSYHSEWYRYTFSGDRIVKQICEPRPFAFEGDRGVNNPAETEELTVYGLYRAFSGDRGFDLQSFKAVILRNVLREKEIFVLSGIIRRTMSMEKNRPVRGSIFYKLFYSRQPVEKSAGFILCHGIPGTKSYEYTRDYRIRPVPAGWIADSGEFNFFPHFQEEQRKRFTQDCIPPDWSL